MAAQKASSTSFCFSLQSSAAAPALASPCSRAFFSLTFCCLTIASRFFSRFDSRSIMCEMVFFSLRCIVVSPSLSSSK